jgi:hypothetical protein
MSNIANPMTLEVQEAAANAALETRIFRIMALSVALSVVIAAPFFPWRVTSGLALGGVLSLLSHHWLRSSVSALITANATNQRVGHSAYRYILRYMVVGVVVFGAYRFGLASLPATIVGLCSFVVALFGEALRQFYHVFIRREEIS